LKLQHGHRQLDLTHARVMGVLNVTPDSFSDGGQWQGIDAALYAAEAMVVAGVDIIDVGGESTRPGDDPVSVQQELDRVVPVIEAIRQRFAQWVSVDTSTPEVMRASVQAGADMINDVRALQREGALSAAAACQVPIGLMHMLGQPKTMQIQPDYQDVVLEVSAFLQQRCAAAVQAGIAPAHLLVDPGFGFGKTLTHNLHLLRALDQICALGYPVLVGVSRKSMLGEITGKPVSERLAASVSAALFAVKQGAAIVRVHDVAATVDALKVWRSLDV
jgi:dihydropteroate synthase